MSSDLFAAFGDQHSPERTVTPSTQIGGPLSSTTSFSQSGGTNLPSFLAEDEEDFGDFEDASAPTVRRDNAQDWPTKLSVLTTPLATVKERPLPFSPAPPKQKGPDIGRHPFADHMDLLFSADDDEYDAGADEMTDLSSNPQAAMEFSKRIIAQQQAEQEAKASAQASVTKLRSDPSSWKGVTLQVRPVEEVRQPNKLRKKSGYAPPRDSNVLFDADEIIEAEGEVQDDDDDFGEFEAGETAVDKTAKPIHPSATATSSMDLLSLDDEPDPLKPASLTKPHPPSCRSRDIHSTLANAPSLLKSNTLDDDAWDDFEDTAPPSTFLPTKAPIAAQIPFHRSTSALAAPSKPQNPPSQLPPTNVPPPSILLSIFPSIFTAADETLFTPISKLDHKQRQLLLAHPATHQFLTGYLALATVLAHIIAGRKLRWKRDTRLVQGMRIGPAGSKGGMKLAGVDKSETAKEDREVLDTVREWKAQIGKLRSAVSAVKKKLPVVWDLAEQMPVKVLKATEGGFTAPHACALCGLRREERVARVDGEVQDSFGEWWVEGMSMHLSCMNFWEEHKARLKSR